MMNFKSTDTFKSTILLGVILLLSCSRSVEDAFDTPATQRVLKVLENCKSTLKSAKDGWYLDYVAPDGYEAQFVMHFLDHDSVSMYADFSDISLVSRYSCNYDQGPVLSFDTYSQLHVLADPETSPVGIGHGGDFEFIIQSVSPDSIILSGRKNRDRVVLHRAIPGLAYKMRFMKQMDLDLGYNISFFHNITVGGAKADIMLSKDKTKLEVTVADKTTISSDIIYTTDGFNLATPVTIGGVSISKFVWNDSSKKFSANETSSIESSNSMTYAPSATADQIMGNYFDLTDYSPALATYYNTLHSVFPNYRQSEIYLDAPTKFETISIRITNGDTTIVKRDTVSNNLTSYSFLFHKAPNATVWNNFKGAKIAKLRDDQLLLTLGIRDGENANDLNKNTTVKNIPSFFYNTSGLSVYIRNSDIYLISIKDGKSWLKLKKGTKLAPIQSIYKIVI